MKSGWILVLPLLLNSGGSESAQPGVPATRPAVPAAVARTTPQKGGEAAVRRLLAEVAAGKPDYDLLAPPLAETLRQQLPRLRQDLLALGQLESVTFLYVNPEDGTDIYNVRLANGVLKFRIRLDARGRVEVADAHMG